MGYLLGVTSGGDSCAEVALGATCHVALGKFEHILHLDVLEVLLDESRLDLRGGPSIIIAGCHTRVVHQVLM